METRHRTRGPRHFLICGVVVLMVVGISQLTSCNRDRLTRTPTDTPTPPGIPLTDLILDPADLPYVTADGEPFYRYVDLTQHPDYHEGMQNPWLLEGEELAQWSWLLSNKDLDVSDITGLAIVSLSDPSGSSALGYQAFRFDALTQAQIDAFTNYLVRQGKDRFRLYTTTDTLIQVWSRDYPEGLAVLGTWLEKQLGLTETPIALAVDTDDLIPHISSDITQEFSELTYPPRCQSKGDCDSSFVDQTCFKCPGSKFVFHNLSCEVRPGITRTETSQGLCWQTQHLYPVGGFYTGECISTMFCLVPWEGQEVPTIDVEETLRVLPLWKQALLQRAGVSDEYFKDHIYVHSTWALTDLGLLRPEQTAAPAQETPSGNEETPEATATRLEVRYFVKVDWATVLETSSSMIRLDTGAELDDATIREGFRFNLTHPIDHIVSQEELAAGLARRCFGELPYQQGEVRLADSGRLQVEAWAQVNMEANRCKHAIVDLEDDTLISCEEFSCWVD